MVPFKKIKNFKNHVKKNWRQMILYIKIKFYYWFEFHTNKTFNRRYTILSSMKSQCVILLGAPGKKCVTTTVVVSCGLWMTHTSNISIGTAVTRTVINALEAWSGTRHQYISAAAAAAAVARVWVIAVLFVCAFVFMAPPPPVVVLLFGDGHQRAPLAAHPSPRRLATRLPSARLHTTLPPAAGKTQRLPPRDTAPPHPGVSRVSGTPGGGEGVPPWRKSLRSRRRGAASRA